MSGTLRVILEVGKGRRRVVAGAMDWPGLDRWDKNEDDALARLGTYLPRYCALAERAGLAEEFARAARSEMEVVEVVPGSSTTDYWGIAHVPSQIEREVLSSGALERRLTLLRAAWDEFDDTANRVSAELRPGPRGGGWTRDEIIRHVHANEPEQFSRKVEVRTPREVMLTADGRAAHRSEYLDALRAYNADGRPARTWPIQFLIRRTAQHLLDHAWDMQDRDLSD
jgi:hypothetical protein